MENIELQTPHGHVAAIGWGDPSGRPILALHGWLDNAASFAPLIPLLSEDLHIVALDLVGHGNSDHKPPGTAYHYIDYVPWILGVVEQLGWDRFSILGHSMGAGLGSLIAASFPACVERLMLIEGLAPLTHEASHSPNALEAFYSGYTGLKKKRLPLYASVDAAAMARHRASQISLESARTLAERGTKTVEGGLTWKTDPQLRLTSPMRFTDEQVLAFLRRIQCPTYLVQATEGFLIQRSEFESQCANIAKLHIETVEGGHHVHMDHPDRVAPLIDSFLLGNGDQGLFLDDADE